jgi:hypothetical protein
LPCADRGYLAENTRVTLAWNLPLGKQTQRGAGMIIFVLTFAVVGLFALTLTGSIASAARRRE